MRKLEIGPGNKGRINKTWETMDIVKKPFVDIVHDASVIPYPIKSNIYDLVYMSHILEHIPWFKTIKTLKEVYRIIKNGGIVEIWVPDFAKIIKAYINPRLMHKDGWYKYNPEKDIMKWINGRIFTYGPEPNWHKTVFDRSYLSKCIKKAGFNSIKNIKKPRGYDHGWINLGMSARK